MAGRSPAAAHPQLVLLCVGGQHGLGCTGHDHRSVFRRTSHDCRHWAAAFLLLVNTAPLNAALINSVGAHIRATAIAVNIFIFHLLGDVPSPSLMGYIADRHSLQTAFILPVIAMAISSAILFYGMRFAPPVRGQAPLSVESAAE